MESTESTAGVVGGGEARGLGEEPGVVFVQYKSYLYEVVVGLLGPSDSPGMTRP